MTQENVTDPIENLDAKTLFAVPVDPPEPSHAEALEAVTATLRELKSNARRERWGASITGAITGIAAALEMNPAAKARVVVFGTDMERVFFERALTTSLRPELVERVIVDVYKGITMVAIDTQPTIHIVVGRISDTPELQ